MAMVIYFAICFGKITFTTLNAYGSFMSLSTIVSGFRRQAALSKRARILFVVLMVAISCVIALLSEPAFLKNFTHFLLFLLAFCPVERDRSDRLLSDFRGRRGYSRTVRSATALRILESLRDRGLYRRRAYPTAVY